MTLSALQRDKLRNAFQAGTLRTRSVSPEGAVEWKRVQAVFRHKLPEEETLYEGETTLARSRGASFILTEGHRIFLTPTLKATLPELSTGDCTLNVVEGEITPAMFLSRRVLPRRPYVYDLTVEDWHNFILHRSGLVVSNSPDRNYRFRPPEGEGQIGCYNQVFGYIWTDEEFYEYLNMALMKWNMHPPETEHLNTLDAMCTQKPVWRIAVLWGALVNAAMALAMNWIVDEFSVVPNTLIRIVLPNGQEVDITIEELYAICYEAV